MTGATGLRRHANDTDSDPAAAAEPDGKASVEEILLPPFVLLGAILIAGEKKHGSSGLLLLSCRTQWPAWRRACARGRQRRSSHPSLWRTVSRTSTADILPVSDKNDVTKTVRFFTDDDVTEIERFHTFHNKLGDVMRIAAPCLITLGLCPLTILLYNPIMHTLWPPTVWKSLPKVNDVIACFLTPAGLIYAISYGFAFQESMGKQNHIAQIVKTQVNLVEQIAALVCRLRTLSADVKREVLLLLKQEVLQWMRLLPARKSCYSPDNVMQGKGLWRLLDLLQDAQDPEQPDPLTERVTSLVLDLENVSTDRMGVMHVKINILQWIFLEILGFFAFFGIFLVRADSYRLELCMCIITIFSISAFCYVLADLDSPFHGAFRVKLAILPQMLNMLENVYIKVSNAEVGKPIMFKHDERPQSADTTMTTVESA